MTRRPSSGRWLQEHFRDSYVKQAQQQGYRSRAAYKLLEIDRTQRLLRPGAVVLDLGAAPGGWSQVAAARVGPHGLGVAPDLLPMAPLSKVHFIQGDAREPAVLEQITLCLADRRVDLVLSDMAPNITGIRVQDAARALELTEMVFTIARHVIRPAGQVLCKVFQIGDWLMEIKQVSGDFTGLRMLKPPASRARSAELYVLATAGKL